MKAEPLPEIDMPRAFLGPDTDAIKEQRRHIRLTLLQIFFLGLAVFTGAIVKKSDSGLEPREAIAALAFIAAGVTKVYSVWRRPDARWYRSRAAAESVKTLVWRYISGGAPFAVGVRSDAEVAEDYRSRLFDILGPMMAQEMGIGPSAEGQITGQMNELRAADLKTRIDRYRRGRVEDQLGWYARKAQWNERRAFGFDAAIVAAELCAAGAAALGAKVLFGVELDFRPIAIILVVGLILWTATKQYSLLRSSYALTAEEVGEILKQSRKEFTEPEWAQFVDGSEEAFSREHTMWRAAAKSTRKLHVPIE